jgi:transcriptional regulator with XRE-family HTH domain
VSSLLRQARDARGWSSSRLRWEMATIAERLNIRVASDSSLRVMLSRWENNAAQPEPINVLLLEEALGLDARSLGIEPNQETATGDLTGLVQRNFFRSGPERGRTSLL